MLKYLYSNVTLLEVPEEISLCISISGCPFRCSGCHSPELWEDQGINLTYQELGKLIETNEGISCVCFMGGNNDIKAIYFLCKYVKINYPNLKTCWYSGAAYTNDAVMHSSTALEYLDYIKEGPYIEELGGLASPTTNQKFYKIDKQTNELIDITYKFQNK